MEQSICNGHHNLETHKHRGEQGVGGTIITPQETLAQFAVIDSTTAVWCGGYSLPIFHRTTMVQVPGHPINSDKKPNKDITLHPKNIQPIHWTVQLSS